MVGGVPCEFSYSDGSKLVNKLDKIRLHIVPHQARIRLFSSLVFLGFNLDVIVNIIQLF